MGGLIVLGVIIAAVIIFDILALLNGVDSRPGFDTARTPSGFSTR